ncbi:MAG: LON peptidase substrate-binding domain-containing protein [Ignavibacteria bacterium]
MAKEKTEHKEITKKIPDDGEAEVLFDGQSGIPDLKASVPDNLPVLPLKDIVVFPYMMFPILAGRDSSIAAINKAVEKDKFILLVTQLDEKIEDPTFENLYKTGTVAKIIQVLRLPNGLIKVLVDGLVTAKINKFYSNKFITADITVKQNPVNKDTELEALIRQSAKLFTDYVKTNRSIPHETLVAFENIKEPDRKLFYIASTISANVHKKQQILEIDELHKQFYEVLFILGSEMEVLNVEKEIDAKIYQTMQKNQKVHCTGTDKNSSG